MSKLENKVKVDRDFVLEEINPYIILAKTSKENIYGKDYSVIHNNHAFEVEHIKICIENDLIEVYNIGVIKKSVYFKKDFLDISVGIFNDLKEVERIYFQIDLDIEIKFLISYEQYNKIYNKYLKKIIMNLQEIKEPQFLNIIYPSSANIEENYNMQQDMFLFINSKQKLIGDNLFYELSFNTMEDRINNLKYFYKKTLDKHLFIPREIVLEHYEYRE